MGKHHWIGFLVLTGVACISLSAQTPVPGAENEDPQIRSTYVLGPDDSIVIRAVEAEEINGNARIDMSGNLRLPLVGRIHAAGMTIDQFETELTTKLSTYIKQPQVSVSILEFRSQPVSVLGSVANAGVHQLQGRKTLVEMISLAGGLRDDAGPIIRIVRQAKWGRIPLANAAVDPSGHTSTAEVPVNDIMEAKDPRENIQVFPDDVISVPRAQMVYLIGEVQKPGGYVLRERQSFTVLQVLSMAGGLSHSAGSKTAKILRLVAGNPDRVEIPVNVKNILSGQSKDIPLLPEDILFVPTNISKNMAIRSMEAAITIGTGLAIYRF